MRSSFVRKILLSYLMLIAGFGLACILALFVLGDVLKGVSEKLPPEDVVSSVQFGQLAVVLLALAGMLGGLCVMAFAIHQANHILDRLRQAMQQMAAVVLDGETQHAHGVPEDDLEDEIQEMIRTIRASHQLYLDASPLTRLPGNNAIEQVLREKMERGEKFALCYIDLDDFKAYNDRYGYAKGSELIKLTGEIIYRAKDQYGQALDFVGHIGGDDFVMITSPEQAAQISEAIIEEFDREIPQHYHEEDRERGYIEGADRYGVTRRFPLMTISIAIVSDVKRSFASPVEIAQVANEIKDYVKCLPGSNYLVDRRGSTRWESERHHEID